MPLSQPEGQASVLLAWIRAWLDVMNAIIRACQRSKLSRNDSDGVCAQSMHEPEQWRPENIAEIMCMCAHFNDTTLSVALAPYVELR